MDFEGSQPQPEAREAGIGGNNGTTGARVSLAEPKGRLVETKEAAALLCLSPRTLEGYRDNGIGPHHYKLGAGKRAKVGYKICDLDAWLEEFAQDPKKAPNVLADPRIEAFVRKLLEMQGGTALKTELMTYLLSEAAKWQMAQERVRSGGAGRTPDGTKADR